MIIPRITLFLAVALGSLSTQAQTCNPNIRESTPASQFVVNANGTVVDKTTGLMWKRCAEGWSGVDCATGNVAYFEWQEALALAANSTYAGYKDWRLPNSKELDSLVEEKCYGPAINLSVFPNAPRDEVWTSSPNAIHFNDHYLAWGVDFDVGFSWGIYGRGGHDNEVLLVRNAQ